jgi:outer membrane protein OmpA-like peptidoglycan-associated protein/tetratricopeptide (TPR) repeat protein
MNTLIRKIIILSFLNFSLLSPLLLSQSISNKEFIRAVQEADLYYYFNEDFEKAASLYEKLHNEFPANSNISAKLGICYLNIDGKKAEALSLLTKATADVVKFDKEYIEYGQKAPLDTWFYLAHAYHVNDSLSKAITLYTDVKKKIGSTEAFRTEYIDNQIKACRFAIEMEKNPVITSEELFIPWLKDYPGATNPVLSENDSVFIFTLKEAGKNHIYCSFNTGSWQKPIDITSQIGPYENLASNSITSKGDLLIVYMDDGADGNLFTSSRKGQEWTRMKKLNKNINTKYWEAHGYITPDGKQLYFSSNRPDGFGELDIWVSNRETDGNWGLPLNLGNTINTPYNENTPFFNPVSGTLLFSSIGHNGMGGYDVFSSTLKNGKWTKPIGMPYPVNTTSDNSMFLIDHTSKWFITSMVEDKTLTRNVYRIIEGGIPSEKIVANGSIGLQDGMNIVPGLAEIKLARTDSSESWKKVAINDSGSYKFDTKPGDYVVQVKYAGYKTDTFNLKIPDNFTGKSLSVSTSMVPDKVQSGDFLAIRNILFGFNSQNLNDQAKIELEKLKSLLTNYPGLNIEVTGYTDNKGTPDYNIKLADKRARAVISYLASAGIPETRFIRKAVGAADFIAINVNPDGTDNPEGRQYNRRVTLGVINPQTGISIRPESYTPPGLRQPYSMRYGVVLMQSSEKYYPDYFKDFRMNELLFVRPVFRDSVYLYVLGEFNDKSDAESYLKFARDKGFKDGYIVNQYDMQEPPRQLINITEVSRRSGETKIYIIQLKASSAPLNINQFRPLEKVKEIKGSDGYYRYVFGEFEGFSAAKTALENIQKSGRKDAFIKEYGLLIKQ